MTWMLKSVLAVVAALIIYRYVSPQELLQALSELSLIDISVLLLISLALVTVSVLKWSLFLHRVGIIAAFCKLFGLYLMGYFVNLLMPSFLGGDIVRSIALGKSTNRTHALAATALERYSGIVVMLAMATVSACVSNVVTPEIVMVVTIAGLGCVVSTWIIFSGGMTTVVTCLRMPQKIITLVDTLHKGLLLGIEDRGLLLKALILSALFHLLTVVNTAAVAFAIGWREVPLDGLLVVVPLILLIGAIPVAPQGLGIQEGAFVYFLHSVGATTGQALAIALVLRAKSYVLALCGGLVWLLGKWRYRSAGASQRERVEGKGTHDVSY